MNMKEDTMSLHQLLYLKPNVQVEPLFDQWYAWPHLIPPATAACNLVQRHFSIMDSYLESPEIHALAVNNPKMRGGPFVDLGGQHVDKIKRLREETTSRRSRLVDLYNDLKNLDSMLMSKGNGFSLQPLYEQVPQRLRGYVELTYDLHHRPSFRLIEPLFYASPMYDTSAQSLMLSNIRSDERPFVLSTPRLETDDALHLHWCFSDTRLDELFHLKKTGRSEKEIAERLEASPELMRQIRPFLTDQAPLTYQSYSGPGVRWRYFGHACILIESAGISILVDPVLSYTYESDISRYTYDDLPDVIDYVLITHNHQDHVLFETMLQLRHKVRNVIVPRNGPGVLQDPSLRLILENTGFSNIIELSEMGSIEFEEGSITAVPFLGEHCDLDIRTKTGYLVAVDSQSFLFAADSCNLEPKLYDLIHDVIGDVDVLFLGMECDGGPLTWLYGPLLFSPVDRSVDHSRRLNGSNYEQAIRIVDALKCKHVYVYAMGQEPWLNYIMSIKYSEQSRPIVESNRLIEECVRRGLTAERLFGEKEILSRNC